VLSSAQAATSFTLSSLNAQVSGSSVTASATVKASSTTAASQFGVCVRTSSGGNADFRLNSGVTIWTAGSSYTKTRTFSNGTYTYYACVKAGSTWYIVGGKKTFVVGASAPSSMPVGDLPGWKQVFTEDFKTNVARGSFGTSSRFYNYSGYYDTSGRGYYNPSKVLSVTNGALDWYIHTADGKHNISAVVPRIPSSGWGQKYGRYSVRFKSDVIPGYKLAMLLWPDNDNWGEGEVDFAEAGVLTPGNHIYTNMYERGNPSTYTPGRTVGFTTKTEPAGTGWHVATVEWSPNKVSYTLDGTKLGTTTTGVPTAPLHLVMQVETRVDGVPISNSSAGHLQVDWVTMYKYAP
jgi:hypothetical protein